jgi:flagellar M-ring protein FliF
MDVLSRTLAQLHDRYRSMTPGSRFMAGLMAAVAVGVLCYVGTQQVARSETDLMHGAPIAPNQLLLMEVAFGKAKLKDYVVRGSSIFVPRGQESAYMAALSAANALPACLGDPTREYKSGGSPFDIGTNRDQQRQKIAMLEELAQAIRMKPGIESASVQYDVDPRPGPFKPKVATAIAYVKPIGTNQLDEATVRAIRDMVVRTFAGLRPEDVAVADTNGRTWQGVIGNDEEDRYNTVKRASEQELQTKILKVLSNIPNVTVNVDVSLKREQAAAASTVAQQSQANRSNDDASRKASAGGVINALLSGTSGESQASEEIGVAVSQPSQSVQAVFTPISARVLVRVPMSYFKSVWQQRNAVLPGQPEKTPDPAALDQIRFEESASIQRCIVPLLPPAKDAASLAEMVTVTPFVELSAATPAFDFRQDGLKWALEYWRAIAAVAFGMLCLLVFRSMVRAKPAEAVEPATPAVAASVAEATPAKAAKVAPPHWRRHPGASERSVREELSELVEEDPESAANILRKWIGQGS